MRTLLYNFEKRLAFCSELREKASVIIDKLKLMPDKLSKEYSRLLTQADAYLKAENRLLGELDEELQRSKTSKI